MRRAPGKVCALFLALLVLLSGCRGEREADTASLYAMGTVMELTAYGGEGAAAEGEKLLRRLDRDLSAQREDSVIWRANHSEGVPLAVSDEMAGLLEETLELCQAVDGALDVTIYPIMEAWGFPSGEYRVPSEAERLTLLELVDHTEVTLEENLLTVPKGMALDLGAVGKGYAGDAILALWREMGVESGLVYLGGNVQCLGAKPDGSDWTVAIRHPEGEGYLATVTGQDMAVVTSGAYQRNFTQNGRQYHHIIDPSTGLPAESGLRSVTIVGEKGFLCDGLATAVYVMGLEEASALWRQRQDFDMILFTDDDRLIVTEGIWDRVTAAEGLSAVLLR